MGGVLAGEDEDRHAVVVVVVPAAGRLEPPSAGDDRAGGHELVDYPTVDARRTADFAGVRQPLVQASPAVAEAVVQSLIGPAMNPSSEIDM
jgi:hypothetical protein